MKQEGKEKKKKKERREEKEEKQRGGGSFTSYSLRDRDGKASDV